MGYGIDGWGSILGVGKTFSSFPQRPDRLWGTSTLLSVGYPRLFPCKQSCRDVKLTTHFHLVSRLRMVKLYLHSPIRLHGVVLYWLSTGISLLFLETHIWGFHIVYRVDSRNIEPLSIHLNFCQKFSCSTTNLAISGLIFLAVSFSLPYIHILSSSASGIYLVLRAQADWTLTHTSHKDANRAQ
jgi:hypothetical protein